ncbi:uracil-DNA glycosylase, family 4 [Thiorhodovibrio winogradskyi]|uniref:Type-4 uracil-DNA glycosylase n=1 Tax=Thiorhodovibrio winogradskyi TaxID=77007 RepID=A0ABZ0S526_9GAMM|nr:uracil-DNA glycosylase family protein [Thiorhodovibrio winogradskyi]
MDLARSRRYLKAVGVVLWRPRDSFDAEPDRLFTGEAKWDLTTDLGTGDGIALSTAPPSQGRASTGAPPGTAPATPASTASGFVGIAAARAALGAVPGAAASKTTSGTRRSLPPVTPPATARPSSPPLDTPIASASPPAPAPSSLAPPGPAPVSLEPVTPAPGSPESAPSSLLQSADAQGIAAMDWPELENEVSQCRRCGLCARRNRTVFGTGNRHASLMLVGEAPGADEDRQGEPFVGRAGQLLTRMLAAIDLPREQVYIGNIIKCRPPGNRDPLPEEIATCRAFIERQISLVAPQLLLCLGRISAQALLQTGDALWELRGRWHSFGPNQIPLLVTYHPSYYLRSPAEKARGWADLQQVARRLRELSPAPGGE